LGKTLVAVLATVYLAALLADPARASNTFWFNLFVLNLLVWALSPGPPTNASAHLDLEMRLNDLLARLERLERRFLYSDPEEDHTAEKTGDHFDVVLLNPGLQKDEVIRAIREASGLELKETEELTDASPQTLLRDASWEEAAALRSNLEAAGAIAEIKPAG
jgi:large subunit ribosomal protein L7/L12